MHEFSCGLIYYYYYFLTSWDLGVNAVVSTW